MSIVGIMDFVADMDKPVIVHRLGALLNEDAGEYTYRITLTQGGSPVQAAGAVVTCYMVSADRSTLTWPGTISGNVVTVTIPRDGHLVLGRFVVSAAVVSGSVIKTVWQGEGVIGEKLTDDMYTPQTEGVPTTAQLLQIIAEMTSVKDAATSATTKANSAATKANTAAGSANTAADNATAATTAAQQATQAAASATANANEAAEEARQAAHGNIFNDATESATLGWTSRKIAGELGTKLPASALVNDLSEDGADQAASAAMAAALLGMFGANSGSGVAVMRGSVADEGENDYLLIKHPGGLMICCKRVGARNLSSSAWNNLYQSPEVDLGEWPEAFAAAPMALVSAAPTGQMDMWPMQTAAASATECGKVRLVRTSSATFNSTVTIAAVGVWKETASTVVMVQPEDTAAAIGDTVSLRTEIANAASYQWQMSMDGGITWTDAESQSAEMSVVLNIGNAVAVWRCKAYGTDGSEVTTRIVHVALPLTIISQPEDYTGEIGEVAHFRVGVSGGTKPYTYQWQYSRTSSGSFSSLTETEGRDTPELLPEISSTRLGYRYRCKITDASGTTVTSAVCRMISASPTMLMDDEEG